MIKKAISVSKLLEVVANKIGYGIGYSGTFAARKAKPFASGLGRFTSDIFDEGPGHALLNSAKSLNLKGVRGYDAISSRLGQSVPAVAVAGGTASLLDSALRDKKSAYDEGFRTKCAERKIAQQLDMNLLARTQQLGGGSRGMPHGWTPPTGTMAAQSNARMQRLNSMPRQSTGWVGKAIGDIGSIGASAAGLGTPASNYRGLKLMTDNVATSARGTGNFIKSLPGRVSGAMQRMDEAVSGVPVSKPKGPQLLPTEQPKPQPPASNPAFPTPQYTNVRYDV